MKNRWKCLGENICSLRCCGDIFDEIVVLLKTISNEMITNIEMFCLLVLGRICSNGQCDLVVGEYSRYVSRGPNIIG